jgi:photosystem II biogenesis protein Psp29
MEYAGYNVAPIEFTAKPVSETVRQFMDSYTKPVVPAYRTIINDLLTTTHLGVVDARFTYTPLFGFGVTTIFKEFFKSYPGGKEEVDQIYDAFVASLDLSPETFKADTAACMEAMEGKTEADVLAIFASPDDSALGKTAAAVQAKMQGPAKDHFLYTRSLGVGMFTVMNAVGIEDISNDDLAKWGGAMGFKSFAGLESDLSLFNDSIQKLREMEQLFKEIEIREKKKLAARLEEKANKAAEAAAKMKAEESAAPAEEAKAEEPAPAAEEEKASADV